ncbi:pseudouridine synthase [[Mycoplasma] mobile]|uniref:Pseudouridine synthase n=1 Tax=Mycoplasma mobile (strain ATCC 43663 / 163K / NCTC 11711) TaxID=267748 RepID=Q688C2_MYCM1|nr:pseudouridine synthase [[Mycoplasma] mobile]AAU14148.1 rluB [Mycoplasma mobile 163K]
MEKIRIQKLISQAGISSRRAAEDLILKKRVKINGVIAKIGDKASLEDVILVDEKVISKEEKVYYLLNKPKNVVTTLKDNFNRSIITDFIDEKKYKIFPVGRLDYDTTGIIILTNDGETANKLLHPKYEIPRIYEVIIDKELSLEEIKYLNSQEVFLNSKKSFQEVSKISNYKYKIKLHQGSYHHIKKLFEIVGKKVKDLNRTEYAFFNLENLSIGNYRKLNKHEIDRLLNFVKNK